MTMPSALRGMAWAAALLAVADPGVQRLRPVPLPVDVRTAEGALIPERAASAVAASATAVRAQLAAATAGDVAINTAAVPNAVVVAGDRIDPEVVAAGIPVSAVTGLIDRGPEVSVTLATQPGAVLPGWGAVLGVEVEGRAMTPGSSSVIVLEAQGIEVDRVEHRWTSPEQRSLARLMFTPPTPGVFPLTIRSLPAAGERQTPRSSIDVRVLSESRQLRVMAFDPRPSWASAFVRRVIEADPDFAMVTQVRASNGIDVSTAAVPGTLSSAALEPFDLVIVGAPEELSTRDVAALESFARRRGGTVVLVADREPAGAYLNLLGRTVFDEVLGEKPLPIVAADGTALRGTEFAVPRLIPGGAQTIATFDHAREAKAPVFALPLGAGQVIFSGALDAWRYRGDKGEAFASFWRGLIARGASRAPRRIELTVVPGVAGPGQRVRVRATVRATELSTIDDGTVVPGVSASLTGPDGEQRSVRLWPAAETGVYEGSVDAPLAGRYDVRARTADGIAADAPLIVEDGAAAPADPDPSGAQVAARATGGVVVTSADLEALRTHLISLPRLERRETARPMRSPWSAGAFIGLLTAEWVMRRRRGLR